MRLFFFILFFLPLCGHANDANQLQEINKKIETVTAQLALDQTQQEKLQQALKNLDLEIAKTAITLKKTEDQLAQTKSTLETLDKQYKTELNNLTLQQEELSEQVRSTFLLGQLDTLKMLFNQTDPHAVGRLLAYFDYFNAARGQMMQQLQANMDDLNQIKTKQEQNQVKLQVILDEQALAHTQLNKQKQAQTVLVERLLTDIEEKNLSLETLAADKKALESVMGNLKAQKSLVITDTNKPLRDYRGQLPWPVQGQVLHRFGDSVVADNKWQGLLIAAPEGLDVHAIYKGRVVYADWLRGFGLIIIVDHGHGYLSLYAHNQSLYKNAGDWVDVNEPIAQVGKSGSIANSGLYFEIRSKGEVQNPTLWLAPMASKS